jgi:hypothetical protein
VPKLFTITHSVQGDGTRFRGRSAGTDRRRKGRLERGTLLGFTKEQAPYTSIPTVFGGHGSHILFDALFITHRLTKVNSSLICKPNETRSHMLTNPISLHPVVECFEPLRWTPSPSRISIRGFVD